MDWTRWKLNVSAGIRHLKLWEFCSIILLFSVLSFSAGSAFTRISADRKCEVKVKAMTYIVLESFKLMKEMLDRLYMNSI